EATGLEAEVGEVCEVRTGRNAATGKYTTLPAEVVGFRQNRTLLMPLGEMHGINPGDIVTATGRRVSIATGPALLGRVIDGLGNPIDGGPPLDGLAQRPITGAPPSPLERPRITNQITLKIHTLNSLVPYNRKQHLNIFADSNINKSSLLKMIAHST